MEIKSIFLYIINCNFLYNIPGDNCVLCSTSFGENCGTCDTISCKTCKNNVNYRLPECV